MYTVKRKTILPSITKDELGDVSTVLTAWSEQSHDKDGNNLDGVPVGAIVDWPITTPPQRWLVCNGQAIPRAKYVRLFKVIGVLYGDGDALTTFNVPNQAGVVGDFLIIFAGV